MTKRELEQLVISLSKKLNETETHNSTPFAEFFSKWLEHHKNYVEINTWNSYCIQASTHIIPYFKDKNISIQQLKAKNLQDYYDFKLQILSNNTILHHHASLHSCLEYAIIQDIIEYNPAKKIKLPKKNKYINDYYSSEELKACIKLFANDILQPAVIIAGVLGLRRSEVLGLKWSDINFENKTLEIKKVVVKTNCPTTNKQQILIKSRTKTEESQRDFILPDFLLLYLFALKQKQNNYDIINKKYVNYICIDKKGNLFKPDYITNHFKLILEKNNFKIIRYHDLRHSCATILHENDISLKDIQEFLGHTDIRTTANIYTHFNKQNKKRISKSLENLFNDL